MTDQNFIFFSCYVFFFFSFFPSFFLFSFFFFFFFFWPILHLNPGVHWINLRRESDFPHEQIKLTLLFMVSIRQCKKALRFFFFLLLSFIFSLSLSLKKKEKLIEESEDGRIKSSVSCEQTPSLSKEEAVLHGHWHSTTAAGKAQSISLGFIFSICYATYKIFHK